MAVLIIDADSQFVERLVAALKKEQIEAIVTDDGKTGLGLAYEQPEAIVLCVELPRTSGYSVCNKLKKDKQLQSIPLLLTSTEATEETFAQHKRLRTSAEAYFMKTVDPASIVEKILSYRP